jgi:hypothetical protein
MGAGKLTSALGLLFSLLLLSACGSQDGPPPGVKPGPKGFSVTSLPERASLEEVGTARLVGESEVHFVLGGSGSCPPAIERVEATGARVALYLEQLPATTVCTADFTTYGFRLTATSYSFSETTVLTVGSTAEEQQELVWLSSATGS